MAFLEPEQLFAVAISAQHDVDMPIDDSSPDYMINVALSPSFIDAMYIDKFCEEIFNSNDYSLENQYTVAIDVIEDTITHRWVKHLKPLATNCKKSFIDYSEKKFQSSTCVIKTLANILSVMVAFENMYAYEPVSSHDQLAHQKEKFITKLESYSTVDQLIETIEPEDLRGDAIAVATMSYYEKMCDKFGKGDIGRLFVKSKQSLKNKQKNNSVSTTNKPAKQSNAKKTKSDKPTTNSFIKGMAELAGGGILLLIGSSASSGFFIAAGTLGIVKGLYTLFISSSAAIWRKIPKPNIPTKDKTKFRILLGITLLMIVWLIVLLVLNIMLDHEVL